MDVVIKKSLYKEVEMLEGMLEMEGIIELLINVEKRKKEMK